jgi:hypothetical protein
MKKHVPPKVKKFPTAKQRVLDELLDKNSEGTITASERVKLQQLVTEAEELMVANAKRLARFSQSDHRGRAGRCGSCHGVGKTRACGAMSRGAREITMSRGTNELS